MSGEKQNSLFRIPRNPFGCKRCGAKEIALGEIHEPLRALLCANCGAFWRFAKIQERAWIEEGKLSKGSDRPLPPKQAQPQQLSLFDIGGKS